MMVLPMAIIMKSAETLLQFHESPGEDFGKLRAERGQRVKLTASFIQFIFALSAKFGILILYG